MTPLPIYSGDSDIDEAITTYEAAMTETATEVLGRARSRKKPWATPHILEMCNEIRKPKGAKRSEERACKYKEKDNDIKKETKKANQEWIEDQCRESEDSLNENDSETAYQTVKDFTSTVGTQQNLHHRRQEWYEFEGTTGSSRKMDIILYQFVKSQIRN